MLFRRIAFVGVVLAIVAAGVLQIRLMKGASLREIHLLVSQQTKLQRQIAQQDLDLAQLRTPWRVADRMTSAGADILPPSATRASVEPKKPGSTQAPGDTPLPAATEVVTHTNRPGGAASNGPAVHSPAKDHHAGPRR